MNKRVLAAVATVLAAGSALSAAPIIHFDINGITVQARNSGGQNSAFGGLAHTGSLAFGFQSGTSELVDISIQQSIGGQPVHQDFTGQLTNFSGNVNLSGGRITGGNFTFADGADTYSADIVPDVGAVGTYVGGGFTLQGLTINGHFSGNHFAGVDVSPWFNAQTLNGIIGSFLQFNWNPNAQGFSYADMDIFAEVSAIPLPPAAWTGLSTLAGVGLLGYIRRRR
jgi:hypothetical protein